MDVLSLPFAKFKTYRIMRLIVFFLCGSLLNLCSSYEIDGRLGKIIFANLLYRHGDRTPIKFYANDPYKDEKLWPVPLGQLTKLGQHQQLLLGQWLRTRYNGLIPESYSLRDIYVRSTDVDRTLMSAAANLAGLYPPRGDQVWDIQDWMPIPIHTIPEPDDYVLAAKKFCQRYKDEMEKLLNSSEITSIIKENAELYSYLTNNTGQTVATLKDVKSIYNNLFIEELNNKTLPDWTKPVYPDKMRPLAVKSFTIPAYNKILQRLKSGNLLKEMIEHMDMKIKNVLNPDRKLWIYSAHDETIANLLMTLNLFDDHIPPYASIVLMELRINRKRQPFVTISYKNSTEEPKLLTLPGCTAACPWKKFVELTKDVVPDNWEKECLTNDNTYMLPISNSVSEDNEAGENSSDDKRNSFYVAAEEGILNT